MYKTLCLRFNAIRNYFRRNNITKMSNNQTDNNNQNNQDNKSQILFTQMNNLMKNDFDNIYEKLELIDGKMQIILHEIHEMRSDIRKSEEIVLINN